MENNLTSVPDSTNDAAAQQAIPTPNRKGLKLVLAVFGLIAVIALISGGAYIMGLQQGKDQQNSSPTPTPTAQTTTTPTPTMASATPTPTPAWKKLSQDQAIGNLYNHSFDVEYPADWTYRKDGCGTVLIDSSGNSGVCITAYYYNGHTIDSLATQITTGSKVTSRKSITVDSHAAVRFAYTSTEQGQTYAYDYTLIDKVRPFGGMPENGQDIILSIVTVKSADRPSSVTQIFDQVVNSITIK